MSVRAALIVLVAAMAGCTGEPPVDLAAPVGWNTDDRGNWWIPGTDTSRAFRNLGTFAAMGVRVPEAVYRAGVPLSGQSAVARDRMVSAVQRQLIALYRNRPETVDSLFWRYVAPTLQAARGDADPEEQVEAYERDAYRRIMRHFRAPAAKNRVGIDIPIVIPDSLRVPFAGRAVAFQIFVDESGRSRSVQVLRPLHPILDRIALKAVTQVTWQPAYVLRTTRSVPVDGWVRLAVRFPALPAEAPGAPPDTPRGTQPDTLTDDPSGRPVNPGGT